MARLEGPAPWVINVSDPSQGIERFIDDLEYEALLAEQPASTTRGQSVGLS